MVIGKNWKLTINQNGLLIKSLITGFSFFLKNVFSFKGTQYCNPIEIFRLFIELESKYNIDSRLVVIFELYANYMFQLRLISIFINTFRSDIIGCTIQNNLTYKNSRQTPVTFGMTFSNLYREFEFYFYLRISNLDILAITTFPLLFKGENPQGRLSGEIQQETWEGDLTSH